MREILAVAETVKSIDVPGLIGELEQWRSETDNEALVSLIDTVEDTIMQYAEV